MKYVERWTLGAFALLALVACSDSEGSGKDGVGTTVDGEPDDPELNGIVRLHNEVRAEVGQPKLGWSPDAAEVAAAYAEKCDFSHNSDRGDFGENLYASTAVSTPEGVVNSWASEKADYDYDSNTCASGKVCGHYTQIVWGKTTGVGCARKRCTNDGPFGGREWDLWVCNYSPPGNYVGQKPY